MNRVKQIIVSSLKFLFPNAIYCLIKNVYYLSKVDIKDHEKNISNVKLIMLKTNEQAKELDRVKQRSIITDGKLNYLLYGKVSSRFGEINNNLLLSPKNTNEVMDNVNFTFFLRGEVGELKKRYFQRTRAILGKELIDANFISGKNLLDLGAGDGHVTSVFHEVFKFGKITGVDSFLSKFEDSNISMFEYITTNVIDYLSFTDRKPHFINAIHVLEHLPLADQYFFLRKCYEVLEVGGYLYIEVPNIYNYMTLTDYFWSDEQHLKLFPLSAFRILIEKIGFIPYYGVYTRNNDFIALDDYHSLNAYNENMYTDIFLLMRKK